jgi:hypothetical protein
MGLECRCFPEIKGGHTFVHWIAFVFRQCC